MIIVKTMFRFWPRSPSSLNQPRNKALVRNLSAFTTLFAPGKSWDNVRTTTAPYTESRLRHLVRNKCVGFPVVEHYVCKNHFSMGLKKAKLFITTYILVLLVIHFKINHKWPLPFFKKSFFLVVCWCRTFSPSDKKSILFVSKSIKKNTG